MMNDYAQIKKVIHVLENEFTLSTNPNTRKGGLVGLATTAIALGRVSTSTSPQTLSEVSPTGLEITARHRTFSSLKSRPPVARIRG